MVLGFTIAQVAIALVVGLYAIARGIARRPPDDVSVLGTALVELLLLAQLIVALVAPAVDNGPTGDVLKFWMYLAAALLTPFLAGGLALVERSRWSTVVIGVAALGTAVMVWRMQVIWTG